MDIIENQILLPDKIDLKAIYKALTDFKNDIYESIRNGERKYLPNGNAKELESYKFPSREQGVRGVLAWNICEPTRSIEFPAKVSLLKMNIIKPEDIEDMKETNPELYRNIIDKIFNDKTNIFVTRKKNSKGELVPSCSGLQVLAIPTNERIPEWAMPYIDYTTMINNILSPFKSVLETFNMKGIEEGSTGRKTTGLSNIIKI